MGWFLLQDWNRARTCNIKNTRKHAHEQSLHAFFPVTSFLYCVLELLLGNLDVAMTDISLGTSRQNKTHHISHSCGHTAVFLVLLGVVRLCCHALLSFSFRFCLFWRCHLMPRARWHNRNLLVLASVYSCTLFKLISNLDCIQCYRVSCHKLIMCNHFFCYTYTQARF